MDVRTRNRSSEYIDGKDSVGLYLDEIAKTPLLTAEDEVELAQRIEAGLYAERILAGDETTKTGATTEELEYVVADGKSAMQRFVQANLRLVVAVARKYGHAQLPLLDLSQEGNTGLIRAVEKFDYTKGYKFSTYATWWVRQAISRGIAQQGRIVRLPVHVAEQINQIAEARRNLIKKLGREPHTWEIAEAAGVDLERITDLLGYAQDHVSLDAPIDSEGDTTLGDLMAQDTAVSPDDAVLDAADRERIEKLLASLDERSADIVRRRYGLVDGSQAKLSGIGEVWGITAERVRQLERAALNTMRHQDDDEYAVA
jgi:RNA polymerase sigma factor (sigma-70 family)